MRFREISELWIREGIRVLDEIEGRTETRVPARKSQLQIEQSENNGNARALTVRP